MPPKDTLNINYLKFKESLPDNLRLTPEKDYHMYDYWRLSGEPENFREGKRRGMFTWDRSDKGYHAGSIVEDRNTGIYHFMKPKHHPTVKYELDWFNKGLQTLEGGKQVPVEGKDKEFWEDFTSKYQLDTTGVDYRYVPTKKKGGNIHIKKKNRGKFTEYCGGKVTEECIRKGKNSSNPTIRKRATFAANARKWKHKNGGQMIPDIIKFFRGGKTVPSYDVDGFYEVSENKNDAQQQWQNRMRYDMGSRDPEAVMLVLPKRVDGNGRSLPATITSTLASQESERNGQYNHRVNSKSMFEYEDGTYDKFEEGEENGNYQAHHSYGLTNGDRFNVYRNNDREWYEYNPDYGRTLGMNSVPKPRSLK